MNHSVLVTDQGTVWSAGLNDRGQVKYQSTASLVRSPAAPVGNERPRPATAAAAYVTLQAPACCDGRCILLQI
jgi:alpha-tubulin suppressor-like RCC1 family protein